MKQWLNSTNNNEPLTKKLIKFISNENKDKFKNNSYDTINKPDNEKVGNSQSNEKNNLRNNDKDITYKNSNDMYSSDSLSHYLEKETNDKIAKLVRFGVDYCRASPNISLINNKSLITIGWRTLKFNYDVEFEKINYKGEKIQFHSIMTAIPINKSVLNFDDDFVRESYSKVLTVLCENHKNLLPYLHFDILPAQKLMIKIQKLNENGSIKDLMNKSYPINTYSKKYPSQKSKALHYSLISAFGKQILEALKYLHNNKWYHMHLHTGNILVDDDGISVKLTELENFVNDLPIKNENLFNYAFENFNSKHYLNNKNDYNSSVLSEIFKNNFNIYEKIDIISFGRVLYEMTTGRELKAPFPDPIEYKEMESDIVEVLTLIFNIKTSLVNSNYMYNVPEVTAEDLLQLKLFNHDKIKEENSKNILLMFLAVFEKKSEMEKENLISHNNSLIVEYDGNYCSFIKENIFNQSKYLKIKLKSINNYLNKN